MQFTFSEQVKILMDRKNMSISALADALGVSRQNLSKRLKNNNFDIAWMQNIAQELGTAVTITLNELQGSINAQSLVYMQATAIPQASQTEKKPQRKKPGPKPDPNKKKKLTKAEEYEKKWKTDKYGITYFDMPGAGWVPAERTANGFNGLDLDEVAKIKADYEKNEWPLVKKIMPEDYESLRIDGFLPVPDECLLPPDDQHDWQIIPKPGDFFGRRSWLCDDDKTYAIDIPVNHF